MTDSGLGRLTKAQADFMVLMQNSALPVLAAPMFLVSGPELVIACGQAGIVGAFPAANARTIEALADWMQRIRTALNGEAWAMNMIVHSSYERFEAELDLVRQHQPKILSTALGSPKRVRDAVHDYGGIVVADVITPTFAKKAADAGADVLILVSAGAGGHTGSLHPFAFINEVRRFWEGPIGLAGAISTGRDLRAAQVAGADFVWAGTRFIACRESLASDDYRDLLVSSDSEDLVMSKAVSGVMASWLKPTLDKAGFTEAQLREEKKVDFSRNFVDAPKAWKTVWSAGQGLATITTVQSVAELVADWRRDYAAVLEHEAKELTRIRHRFATSE